MVMNLWTIRGSTERTDQENVQAEATQDAVKYAGKAALATLAASSALILGGAHLFPRFNRSLSVSSKTALIVSPAFGVFFLLAEIRMNERKRERGAAARAAQAAGHP